ncbi:hypothetical protein PR048_000193 [Dryococelus australis]|uniref:Uncharacterized protein n=1 Tax=Dryococelus australis TaxID=614101 RepID=A0ABQ9IE49_9NEOP|nr:hypothetical protein PR048_000193 [Dryococelus australis]
MAPGIVILEVTQVHSVKTPQCREYFIIHNVTIGLCVHATTDKNQQSYAQGRETQTLDCWPKQCWNDSPRFRYFMSSVTTNSQRSWRPLFELHSPDDSAPPQRGVNRQTQNGCPPTAANSVDAGIKDRHIQQTMAMKDAKSKREKIKETGRNMRKPPRGRTDERKRAWKGEQQEGMPVPRVNAVRLVQSLALSDDGAFDANGIYALIAPALLGLKRGKKSQYPRPLWHGTSPLQRLSILSNFEVEARQRVCRTGESLCLASAMRGSPNPSPRRREMKSIPPLPAPTPGILPGEPPSYRRLLTLKFTALYTFEPTLFLHWLLPRRYVTPYPSELHVIGARGCEAFINWSKSPGACQIKTGPMTNNRKQSISPRARCPLYGKLHWEWPIKLNFGIVYFAAVLQRQERREWRDISEALNVEVLRADECEMSAGMRDLGKREIPEKTRRTLASAGTILTCKNPGWEASSLPTPPPRHPYAKKGELGWGEHTVTNQSPGQSTIEWIRSSNKGKGAGMRVTPLRCVCCLHEGMLSAGVFVTGWFGRPASFGQRVLSGEGRRGEGIVRVQDAKLSDVTGIVHLPTGVKALKRFVRVAACPCGDRQTRSRASRARGDRSGQVQTGLPEPQAVHNGWEFPTPPLTPCLSFLQDCGLSEMLTHTATSFDLSQRSVGGRGSSVDRALASHEDEPGSLLDGIAPRFSHVGIVPDDVTGRRVFSDVSRFPRPCISVLLHTHLPSPSSVLETSLLRAAQLSPPDLSPDKREIQRQFGSYRLFTGLDKCSLYRESPIVPCNMSIMELANKRRTETLRANGSCWIEPATLRDANHTTEHDRSTASSRVRRDVTTKFIPPPPPPPPFFSLTNTMHSSPTPTRFKGGRNSCFPLRENTKQGRGGGEGVPGQKPVRSLQSAAIATSPSVSTRQIGGHTHPHLRPSLAGTNTDADWITAPGAAVPRPDPTITGVASSADRIPSSLFTSKPTSETAVFLRHRDSLVSLFSNNGELGPVADAKRKE